MMNVLLNLISLCNSLPKNSTYRSVASAILENLRKISSASIYDAMEITTASRSTISRMIKRMGYDHYSEFRHELHRTVSQYGYYNWGLALNGKEESLDYAKLAASQLQESAEIIQQTFHNDFLLEVAQCLHSANRISIYDFPSTTAYFLIQNLSMDGKQTRQYSLYPDMEEDIPELSKDSVVISYPIHTPDMMDMTPIYRKIRERGAVLILGTDAASDYRKYGDIFLFPANYEGKYPLARRHAFEMFYILVSEVYRKEYLMDLEK